MKELLREITDRGIETVRFSFADQHGLLRSKSIAAAEVPVGAEERRRLPELAARQGHLQQDRVPGVHAGRRLRHAGAGRRGRCADGRGRVHLARAALGAAHRLAAVRPQVSPTASRCRSTRAACCGRRSRGWTRRATATGAGLEIEFHIFRILDARLRPEDAGQPGSPPEVGLLSTGYQLLSETRYDQLEPALEILRANLAGLGLPLRSFECEFGPSQAEVTLGVQDGLAAADAMILFRSATKQILRRHGYHATFMCRPKLPNVMSSGWHLHQSLAQRTGRMLLFRKRIFLSETGKQFLAGLLEHARASAAFATPTINGYKRYRPYSLAPERVTWGRDNRGVMVRVLGGPGDPATRIENRIGEPGGESLSLLCIADPLRTGRHPAQSRSGCTGAHPLRIEGANSCRARSRKRSDT